MPEGAENSPAQAAAREPVDYGSPEARAALEHVTGLVLEVRDEQTGPLNRKIALYERTLGLAVIPTLLQRAVIVLGRKLRQGRISS